MCPAEFPPKLRLRKLSVSEWFILEVMLRNSREEGSGEPSRETGEKKQMNGDYYAT